MANESYMQMIGRRDYIKIWNGKTGMDAVVVVNVKCSMQNFFTLLITRYDEIFEIWICLHEISMGAAPIKSKTLAYAPHGRFEFGVPALQEPSHPHPLPCASTGKTFPDLPLLQVTHIYPIINLMAKFLSNFLKLEKRTPGRPPWWQISEKALAKNHS